MKEYILQVHEFIKAWEPFLVSLLFGLPFVVFLGKFLNKKLKYHHKWINYIVTTILSLSYMSMLILSAPISEVNQGILLKGVGILISLPIVTASMSPVKNFIGGFFLSLNPNFKPGDVIKLDGIEGTVVKIGAMKTKIVDKNNRSLFIPNQEFSNKVCKVVDSDCKTAIYTDVGLGYNVNTNQVIKNLKKQLLLLD